MERRSQYLQILWLAIILGAFGGDDSLGLDEHVFVNLVAASRGRVAKMTLVLGEEAMFEVP